MAIKSNSSGVNRVNKDPEVRVKVKSEIAVIKPVVKKISKLNFENMQSIVGDSAEAVQQLLAKGDNDTAVSLIYKSMLSAMVDLIPIVETSIRESNGTRGIYQLSALVSGVRELLVDIQSAQDRGLLGEALVDKIIRPEVLDFGMMIASEYSIMGDDFRQFLSPDDYKKVAADLKLSRTRVAANLMKSYKSIEKSTVDFLQR